MFWKNWFLFFHRWITIIFALPLAAVVLTGLILSIEPSLVVSGIKPGQITPQKMLEWLDEHDEAGKARSLSFRGYEGTLTIGGAAEDGDDVVLDVATGQELEDESATTELMRTSRRLHETLLLDLGWLVTASTIAMLVLVVLGVLMGLPRLRNTLSGWHKGMAWFTLPLLVLSPLTGLFLAFGITFLPAPAGGGGRGGGGQALPIRQAVEIIAAQKDLTTLVNLRQRGGRLMARLVEGGEFRAYAVTKDGLAPLARNWPRLLHEGNWGGHFSVFLNVLTSVVLIGLLGTGLTLWVRRRFFRPRRQGALAAAQGAPK